MATSPTSKSALTSGAAKDDHVGDNGDYVFTIADLLGNDPGGAAKVDVTKQFFFGDSGSGDHSIAAQKAYLDAHHILYNDDFTSFTLTSESTEINYFVQIGNKGTWSQAHVTIDDRPDAPAPEPHAGDLLFQENFDGYSMIDDHGTWGVVNLSTGITDESPSKGHAWAIADGNGGWAGVTGEIVQGNLSDSIKSTSGDFWLDTQNSPGGIDITNWFVDPTGGEFRLSFDLGIHDFGDGPKAETAENAVLTVLVDGKLVDTIDYSDVLAKAGAVEQMGHFEYVVDGGDASAGHTISFVDVTPQADGGNYVGFALDTIQVHDWLI